MTHSNQQTVFSEASAQADAQERSKIPEQPSQQNLHAPSFCRSAWVRATIKQAHLTAAIINTDHIRNCMDRPGTWLSEVSIPLIKNMYVSVRDMFYFNE